MTLDIHITISGQDYSPDSTSKKSFEVVEKPDLDELMQWVEQHFRPHRPIALQALRRKLECLTEFAQTGGVSKTSSTSVKP